MKYQDGNVQEKRYRSYSIQLTQFLRNYVWDDEKYAHPIASGCFGSAFR